MPHASGLLLRGWKSISFKLPKLSLGESREAWGWGCPWLYVTGYLGRRKLVSRDWEQ